MAFTPDQADEILQNAGIEDETKWRQAVNTLLVDLFRQHAITLKGAKVLANESRAVRQMLQQFSDASTAPEVGGDTSMVGSDGTPLDASQAAAEALMNEAAGTHPLVGGDAPPAAVVSPPRGRPMPPRGGVRTGAGAPPPNAPTGDPVQDEAERMMDEAAGPRA